MLQLKRLLLSFLLLFTFSFIAACGNNSNTKTTTDKANADETKIIRIGFTPGPYSDQVKKGIAPILKKKGYEVKYTEFTNGNEVNFALAKGDLDADIFQHTAYFKNFISENNLDLTEVLKVPTAPMGLYSDKFDSYKNLSKSKEYSIAIPNDPPNIARALRILEQVNLIKLKDNYKPITVSTKDIQSYNVKIKFVEVEQAQLARTIPDVDFALVNGNFILASHRKLSDSLYLENPPYEYQNLIAVRTEDKNKQFVKDLIETYKSENFQNLIETDPEFKGFWMPTYFKK
ncbi:MetQ/NlpA family ABC transporter substrate-binding protein [Rummeliibacillus pycnus]|uniref:MetQ/NlpA family ABC transporter substrate-binding protein n=1 Tax=Rummeliibacillus pycnus TaxID=101070 RepID=UPI001FE87E9B|nr:MetQ/NlpA family ABC transporter substrate-binding protein [Rummeliibacillus pycnus]